MCRPIQLREDDLAPAACRRCVRRVSCLARTDRTEATLRIDRHSAQGTISPALATGQLKAQT